MKTYVSKLTTSNGISFELTTCGTPETVAKGIVIWALKTVQLKDKMRKLGFTYAKGLTKSAKVDFSIYCIEDDHKIDFEFKNFGRKVLEKGEEKTAQAIELIVAYETEIIEALNAANTVME